MNTTTRTRRRPAAVPALAALLTTMLLVAPASAAPPVADSGPGSTVVAGTDAQLQGSVSDPDGDDLEIRWMATVVDGGDESSCTFSGPWSWEPVTPEGLAPTLNCTQPGSYLLQLVVGDGTSSDDDIGTLITFTEPDTSPATCSLLRWVKHPAMVRVSDGQSGVASYTVLDSWNVSMKSSQAWSPPTASASIHWSRPGRGAGVALVTHTNGAGLRAECVLFVRRDGSATVVN